MQSALLHAKRGDVAVQIDEDTAQWCVAPSEEDVVFSGDELSDGDDAAEADGKKAGAAAGAAKGKSKVKGPSEAALARLEARRVIVAQRLAVLQAYSSLVIVPSQVGTPVVRSLARARRLDCG